MARLRLMAVALLFVSSTSYAAWNPVGGGLVQISTGSASNIWGVNSSDQIWKWTGTTWQQMPGACVDVAAGSDGTVWCVNRSGYPHVWQGSNWSQVGGGLSQISVGNAANIWGVNGADEIWKWTGTTWQQMIGHCMQVAVGADGTVWCIDRSGNPYIWKSTNWSRVPGGPFTNISVGSAMNVWATNAAGDISRWTRNGWVRMEGTRKQVAVAADGTLWSLDSAGNISYGNVASMTQLPTTYVATMTGTWQSPMPWAPTGIPRDVDDAVVGVGVVLDTSGGAIVRNVDLEQGTLTNGALNVKGNYTSHGGRALGRLIFNGSTGQTFSDSSGRVTDLVVAAGSTVNHSGDTAILTSLSNDGTFTSTGLLTFAGGSVTNNGTMTLHDVAAYPGTSVFIPANVTINGTITGSVIRQ